MCVWEALDGKLMRISWWDICTTADRSGSVGRIARLVFAPERRERKTTNQLSRAMCLWEDLDGKYLLIGNIFMRISWWDISTISDRSWSWSSTTTAVQPVFSGVMICCVCWLCIYILYRVNIQHIAMYVLDHHAGRTAPHRVTWWTNKPQRDLPWNICRPSSTDRWMISPMYGFFLRLRHASFVIARVALFV